MQPLEISLRLVVVSMFLSYLLCLIPEAYLFIRVGVGVGSSNTWAKKAPQVLVSISGAVLVIKSTSTHRSRYLYLRVW